MTTRRPPRYALALLERLVPGSDALAGDLIEDYARRQSRWRVWREVLSAIAGARVERSDEIRPLRLVELQPSDAIERTRRIAGLKPVNMAPLVTVGGTSLAALLVLMTVIMPALWWLFAASIAAGAVLGIVLIAAHRKAVG